MSAGARRSRPNNKGGEAVGERVGAVAPPGAGPPREFADRIRLTLVVLIGVVLLAYFASVPLLGLNLAFHFYLMLWITMA